ncbi:MAG: hypothetical protein AAFW69_05045 [Pseudomonadota bacterium]
MPHLVRFVLRSAATGVAVGWSFLLALLHFDAAGLGSLVARVDGSGVATAMLFVFFGITFGSAAIGIAVMTLPREDG